MKKLVIFMLVLGLASVANATIAFNWNAAAALPGADLTIELIADASEQVSTISLALVNDNNFGGSVTPGAFSADFMTSDPGYKGSDFGYGAGQLIGASASDEVGQYVTGLLYSYTYTIPGTATAGQVIGFTVEDFPDFGLTSVVTLLDSSTMVPADFNVTIIPEPMTIALLGLGGLFLRRRR